MAGFLLGYGGGGAIWTGLNGAGGLAEVGWLVDVQ